MADRTDGGPITQRFAVFRDPENPPDSWRSWSAYTRDFNVEWRGFAGFYEGHGDTRRARKSDAIRRARIDAMTKHAAPTPAPRDVWQHDETGRIVELPAGSPSPGKRYYRVRGMGGDVSVVGRGDEARVVFTPDARPTPPAPVDAVERERDYDAMLDWLDERVGDGRGEVRLGLTDNGGVGCWLPGDETVPEGESVEEAIRFRMERSAEASAVRDGKGE